MPGGITHGRQVNASNTGLNYNGIDPATLTPSARTSFDVDNEVIEGLSFTGRVDVNANGVTIRNCMWVGGGESTFGILVIGDGLTMEGVTIKPAPATAWYIGLFITADAVSTTVHGCDISGCENQVSQYGADTQFIESYIHDSLLPPASEGHADNVEVYGGSATFTRCNLPMGALTADGSINISPLTVDGLDHSIAYVHVVDCAIDGGQAHIWVDNTKSVDTTHATIHNVSIVRCDFGGHTDVGTFDRYACLANADGRPTVDTQAEQDANPDAILWPTRGSQVNTWRLCSDLAPDRNGAIALPDIFDPHLNQGSGLMPGNLTDTAEPIVLDAINSVAAALFTGTLKLRICSANGSDASAGTQYSSSTDQTITFATGGASSNSQTYATLNAGDVKGWEIYDSSGTPKRIWYGLWSPVNCTAQASGDTITSTAHGLSNTQKIVFQSGYAPGGTTAGTTYFVVSATTNNFQISTTSGGSAVDITADSSTVTYGVVKTVANNGDSLVVSTGGITTSAD